MIFDLQNRESKIGKQTFSRKRYGVFGFQDPEYRKSGSGKADKIILTRKDNSGFLNGKRLSILSKVKLLVFDTRKSGK